MKRMTYDSTSAEIAADGSVEIAVHALSVADALPSYSLIGRSVSKLIQLKCFTLYNAFAYC